MKPPVILVFTDLDGTLLDHHTYSHDPALPALAELARRRIPVILSTSKTAAELEVLRTKLNVQPPFIVENGAGIIRIDNSRHVFGARRSEIVDHLENLKLVGYEFDSFTHMGTEGIVAATGLNAAEAELANEREFSEPIIWKGSDLALRRFAAALESLGLGFTRGGRFIHILGRDKRGDLPNKALAMEWLAAHWPKPQVTIALGDGENDLDMLRAADIGVLIKSPVNTIEANDLYQSELIGPSGWNAAILELLQRDDLNG